jgi:hypothetical protein
MQTSSIPSIRMCGDFCTGDIFMNDVDTFKTYSMVDVLERSKQPEPDQVERYTAQDLLDPCKKANEFFEQRNKEVHDAMMRFIRGW